MIIFDFNLTSLEIYFTAQRKEEEIHKRNAMSDSIKEKMSS